MKKTSLYLLIPLISAILLSGCSLEDIFAKLATTNEEQGAREQYVRNQMVEAKQKRIDQKKQQYPFFVQLAKVNDSDPYQAYLFASIKDTSSTIELEAVLPNPGRQIYELWLRNPDTKELVSLGALQFNQTDDYSLSYTGNIDLNQYTGIILTREANPDNQPETVILTGSLTPSTP